MSGKLPLSHSHRVTCNMNTQNTKVCIKIATKASLPYCSAFVCFGTHTHTKGLSFSGTLNWKYVCVQCVCFNYCITLKCGVNVSASISHREGGVYFPFGGLLLLFLSLVLVMLLLLLCVVLLGFGGFFGKCFISPKISNICTTMNNSVEWLLAYG